jgi:hypothetical protein
VSQSKIQLISLTSFASQHPDHLDQVFSSPIMQNFDELSAKEIPEFTKFLQESANNNPNVNFDQAISKLISFTNKYPNDVLNLFRFLAKTLTKNHSSFDLFISQYNKFPIQSQIESFLNTTKRLLSDEKISPPSD